MMKAWRSADGLTFHLSSDGFSYSDFNKAGKVDPWNVSRHFEAGRAVLFNHDLRDALQISRVRRCFMRFQKIELLPDFYAIVGTDTDWVMDTEISYVGNTSYLLQGKTRCQKTGLPLLRNLGQLVMVDTSTRPSRPVKINKEALAAHHRQSATSAAAPRFQFPSGTVADPDRVFRMTTTALPSETDLNQHVNQSICLKYCLNCASLAAMQGGVLRHFTTDMAHYDAKSLSVWYISEMHPGDEVVVECWQDPNDVRVLYFQLKTRGSVAIQVVGEWYGFKAQHNPAGNITTTTRTSKLQNSKL